MKLRIRFTLAIVLVLVGFSPFVYLADRIVTARIYGIFAAMRTESPNKQFQASQCPPFLSLSDTVPIQATIRNATDAPLVYSTSIEANGLRVLPGEETFEGTIPAYQTKQASWSVTPLQGGVTNITFQVISNTDSELPGPFHTWPTSYRVGCGIWVMPGPWRVELILALGLVIMLIGGFLCDRWRIKRGKGRGMRGR